MRKPTALERPCACGCGAILSETYKHPPTQYLNRQHWLTSAARANQKGNTRADVRAREHRALCCPCPDCSKLRFADRTALIAQVAAEMGVGVSTAQAKPITPASLAAKAAKRRARRG